MAEVPFRIEAACHVAVKLFTYCKGLDQDLETPRHCRYLHDSDHLNTARLASNICYIIFVYMCFLHPERTRKGPEVETPETENFIGWVHNYLGRELRSSNGQTIAPIKV